VTTVAKFIKKRMAGLPTDDAVAEAVDEAGAELVEEEVVTAAIWESVAVAIGTIALELVATAVIFFMVMFIASFIVRAYKIAVSIHNWDTSNHYVVDSWYGDNAIVDGSQAFSPIILPPPSGT
jgi:hypothetical protein